MALVALWLLAGALVVRQAVAVLRQPPDERLTDLLGWIGDNGVLQVRGSFYDGATPFTGTPFAGLVLKPLTSAAEQGLGVAWTFGTLLLVAAVGVVAARALPAPVSPRTKLFAVPVALSLLVVSVPVRSTFTLGQTSILPVLLALVGWLMLSDRRASGVLIGLAAALQPAVLLFVPLLWFTGRRSAAVTAGGTFAAGTALAWLTVPGDSWTYWVHHVAGAGLGDPSDAVTNQSLHGALLRIGLSGPLEVALLVVLACGVGWLALRRAVHYAQDGQALLAAALVGCAIVAVSPTAWQHQLLWILLAVVGRIGRRTSDRLMWPVLVVLVMSLESEALVPDMAGVRLIGDNAPLLAALAAACVVPFLTRDSAKWDAPEPTGPLSRPNLLLELLLIRVGYWAYSYVRGDHSPENRATAEGNGSQILDFEHFLRLDMEHWLNQFTARTQWVEVISNFYYSTFHFLVPIALLAVLYIRRPPSYRRDRAALAFATLLGLVGFWLYPLAPPRLMPGLGYVDTAHGPQDLNDPNFGALTELSNQYAAMPSLHVGWSLWCAVVVIRLTPNVWLRVLGVLYPLLTTFVVMATANHYLLDAVGGAIVVAAGFAIQQALVRLRILPKVPADAAAPEKRAEAHAGDQADEHAREPAPLVPATVPVPVPELVSEPVPELVPEPVPELVPDAVAAAPSGEPAGPVESAEPVEPVEPAVGVTRAASAPSTPGPRSSADRTVPSPPD
ncbi:phosphatase PAP2 family protein [Streptomyces sp. N2-109]|uniref:Phosphatase PAP2 family protein n=1 Tax=Streptomyces gossypii TaxID=2883101 RepID=A0ABT2JSH7_9ACTN|nr:phosphatase PAP2 family protein [Streptomyces gossypii]MCT2590214.1 phosphatase PAP2 family protein [Streptomyces gossypii]